MASIVPQLSTANTSGGLKRKRRQGKEQADADGMTTSRKRIDNETRFTCRMPHCSCNAGRISHRQGHQDRATSEWLAGAKLFPCANCRYISCHRLHALHHHCRAISNKAPVPAGQNLDMVAAEDYFAHALKYADVQIHKIPRTYINLLPQLQHIPKAVEVLDEWDAMQQTSPAPSPQQVSAHGDPGTTNATSDSLNLDAGVDLILKSSRIPQHAAHSCAPTMSLDGVFQVVPQARPSNLPPHTVSQPFDLTQHPTGRGNKPFDSNNIDLNGKVCQAVPPSTKASSNPRKRRRTGRDQIPLPPPPDMQSPTSTTDTTSATPSLSLITALSVQSAGKDSGHRRFLRAPRGPLQNQFVYLSPDPLPYPPMAADHVKQDVGDDRGREKSRGAANRNRKRQHSKRFATDEKQDEGSDDLSGETENKIGDKVDFDWKTHQEIAEEGAVYEYQEPTRDDSETGGTHNKIMAQFV